MRPRGLQDLEADIGVESWEVSGGCRSTFRDQLVHMCSLLRGQGRWTGDPRLLHMITYGTLLRCSSKLCP